MTAAAAVVWRVRYTYDPFGVQYFGPDTTRLAERALRARAQSDAESPYARSVPRELAEQFDSVYLPTAIHPDV